MGTYLANVREEESSTSFVFFWHYFILWSHASCVPADLWEIQTVERATSFVFLLSFALSPVPSNQWSTFIFAVASWRVSHLMVFMAVILPPLTRPQFWLIGSMLSSTHKHAPTNAWTSPLCGHGLKLADWQDQQLVSSTETWSITTVHLA